MSVKEGVQNDDGTFVRSTLDEITERKKQKAIELYGPDVDLSQGSPVKQIIDTSAHGHERLWKVMESVYYSAYYDEAHGTQLDKLLSVAQINRRPRRGATGVVNFSTLSSNDTDVVIRQGTKVSTHSTEDRPPIPFKTTEPARLEAGSSTVTAVPVRAAEPWETDLDPEWLGEETNVAAGTIENFQTAVRGIDHVTNPYPTGDASREHGYSFIKGRDRETDREFRNRFEKLFGSEAWATLDAIEKNLLALDGALNVGMEENTSMQDNSDSETGGLPPKAFRATILGDLPARDVADTIFDRRPAGIQSWGDESADAIDDSGDLHTERWDWAEDTHIYVEVDVTHDENYPQDGNLKVENAVVEEIGGETVDGEEFVGTGMGEDVIYDIIHSECMAIPGVWRVNVRMGIYADDLNPTDVAIQDKHTAMTDYTDVSVFNEEKPRE